jgi:hypothetical protein
MNTAQADGNPGLPNSSQATGKDSICIGVSNVAGDPKTNTPICNRESIEVLSCTDHGGGWLYAVPLEIAKSLEREKRFYRILLEQIAGDKRRTRGRRLAESGLLFWDRLQEEKAKRKP